MYNIFVRFWSVQIVLLFCSYVVTVGVCCEPLVHTYIHTYIYVFFIMKHCVWIWGHGVLGLLGYGVMGCLDCLDPGDTECCEMSVTVE